MIRSTFTTVLVLACLIPAASPSDSIRSLPLSVLYQEKNPQEPPLLSFSDLQKSNLADGPFRKKGFVIQTFKCPPCPAGMQCKPCLGDHIILTDDVDEKDPALLKRLRIFTNKPEQFELKKKYLLLVKTRRKTRKDRAIEELDLIRFDLLETFPTARP